MKSKLTNNNKRYNQVRLERTNTCWSRSPKKGSEMKSSWVHNKILHPHPSPLTTGRTRIPFKQTHPLTTLSDFHHDSTQLSKKQKGKRPREHDTKNRKHRKLEEKRKISTHKIEKRLLARLERKRAAQFKVAAQSLVLRQLSIFQDLSAEHLVHLIRCTKHAKYAKYNIS